MFAEFFSVTSIGLQLSVLVFAVIGNLIVGMVVVDTVERRTGDYVLMIDVDPQVEFLALHLWPATVVFLLWRRSCRHG